MGDSDARGIRSSGQRLQSRTALDHLVLNAVGDSAYWKDTAVILAWDDWGGWYDNAKPPQINYTSLGFRVPMIVISPYARPSSISNTRI